MKVVARVRNSKPVFLWCPQWKLSNLLWLLQDPPTWREIGPDGFSHVTFISESGYKQGWENLSLYLGRSMGNGHNKSVYSVKVGENQNLVKLIEM